jgi:hypothetical protein
MKTLRIAMLATIVAFAFTAMANADEWGTKPAKKVINITFAQAIQLQEVVTAMYQQLDKELIKDELPVYTFTVELKNYTVRVSGSYAQWNNFFRMKWYYSHNTFTLQPKE